MLNKITILSDILFVIISWMLISINLSFLRKIKEHLKNIKEEKEERGEKMEERSLSIKDHKHYDSETIIIDHKFNFEKQKKESISIPSKLRNQIEKIILQILYKEKSVKSLKLLNDKVLENAAKQKVTVSEKVINVMINQMNKNKKIEFTQKEGWKIKI
ncbi:MAG: hypothetical protein ACFFA0_13185 [Promethearchaeota archaeon]